MGFGPKKVKVMSNNCNKSLVRQYYEQVVNTGDVDRLAEFISPDYVEVHNNPRHPIGLEGAREQLLGVRSTYPDLHLTVERRLPKGNGLSPE